MELMAFADRVISASDATFRLPELAMGLIPGAGGTWSVVQRMGRQRANWFMLTGAEIDAVIDEMHLPNGTPFRQFLEQRRQELQAHWEKKGYRFFADRNTA